jgi:adenylate cyclase
LHQGGEKKNQAISLFMEAIRGAGFTNITVDPDGIRRRIFLAQEVKGHWYLQLALTPLMASWGNPAITLLPQGLFHLPFRRRG